MDAISLLRSIPLFEDLLEDDLKALSSSLVSRTFAAGTMIINQGDAGSAQMFEQVDQHRGFDAVASKKR